MRNYLLLLVLNPPVASFVWCTLVLELQKCWSVTPCSQGLCHSWLTGFDKNLVDFVPTRIKPSQAWLWGSNSTHFYFSVLLFYNSTFSMWITCNAERVQKHRIAFCPKTMMFSILFLFYFFFRNSIVFCLPLSWCFCRIVYHNSSNTFLCSLVRAQHCRCKLRWFFLLHCILFLCLSTSYFTWHFIATFSSLQ